MPEGQCAKCGEAAPTDVFLLCELDGEEDELAFCSPECKEKFVQGMIALMKAI